MPGPEFNLVEKPVLDILAGLGYQVLDKAANELARDGLNQVLFRDHLLDAVQRLNGVGPDTAESVYNELLGISDNRRWIEILRGQYAKSVPDQRTQQTIRLIDFQKPANNTWAVTNQLYVQSEHSRIPDVVIYVNGIPVVVLEAKVPGKGLKTAYEQIRQYEAQIPRLFHSNAFNLVTDAHEFAFGATAADWGWWSRWRDPWPRQADEFGGEFETGLWSLLEPSRLLDLLAHFIVFETDPDSGTVVKKICRYQQYRAVRKISDRIADPDRNRGLIWHTQGSGKSLTMVFAALRAKMHRTDPDPAIPNPSVLVVTDRKDLDRQITNTFQACGLPNPKPAGSKHDLQTLIHSGTAGLTVLSTIQKFEGSRKPVPNSADWIVFVDEAHRGQEKDLGAFLRATFPNAQLFGFTGTPVKKGDLDTFQNFGHPGDEGYLDRYSIDDAVRDGATVPIRYTSRMTQWHVDPEEIDQLFDNWFQYETEERREAIKKRGVTLVELAKHPERVARIAKDIWAHFRGHAQPDGYTAQVVAIDREAAILYKRALDDVIATTFINKGMPEAEARERAASMSAPVYSSAQDDEKPSDDPRTEALRADLRRYALDEAAEKEVVGRFHKKDAEPSFLIVCHKLLTGFDAPRESVMYLDSPLSDHNLLQAIARTNRVCGPKKRFGLIVDYIGVTRKLDEALSAYRTEDVVNALRDLDEERDVLRDAHRALFRFLGDPSRAQAKQKEVYDALATRLQPEDAWYTFRRLADAFIGAYESLSPEPAVLEFQWDLKWTVEFIRYATPIVEKDPPPDLSDLSPKIREILEEHLSVTGLKTIVTSKTLVGAGVEDPSFFDDFRTQGKSDEELKHATIRKATELKKITYDKAQENPAQYGPFSERVLEVIRKYEEGQLAAAQALLGLQEIALDLKAETEAYKASGLTERAYGLLKILEEFTSGSGFAGASMVHEPGQGAQPAGGTPAGWLAALAEELDAIYGSPESAPAGWHRKEQQRKSLRQQVRLRVHQAGFSVEEVKEIPSRVESYALKHHVRLG